MSSPYYSMGDLSIPSDKAEQFSSLFSLLTENLDITKDQYDLAVESYMAVGRQLSKEGSPLAMYNPEIRPQGSFLVGTMVRPLLEEDDLDVDLICELFGKEYSWTQKDVKDAIGLQLRRGAYYAEEGKLKEGRRCWTIYFDGSPNEELSNFHLDILPAVNSNRVQMMSNKSLASNESMPSVEAVEISITDRMRSDYEEENNHQLWLKSNPLGYAEWFFRRAALDEADLGRLRKGIQQIPLHSSQKLPLQKVIQILKRHRDIQFQGDEDKPISIIITTLAAKAYRQEEELTEALFNIVNSMGEYVEERENEDGVLVKWIGNPINEEENFADKWLENPRKEQNFYSWLDQIKNSLKGLLGLQGLDRIQKSMGIYFGEREVNQTFSQLGRKQLQEREDGKLKAERGTGRLGAKQGDRVKPHNFYGKEA